MKKTMIMTMGVLLTLLGTSCSSDSTDQMETVTQPNNNNPEDTVVTFDLTEAQMEMVGNSNDFAFRLMQIENGLHEGKSFVISPLSAGFLLGMINNGANGETQQELRNTLGFKDTDNAAVNDYFHHLLKAAPVVDQKVKLRIANMLYANKAKGIQFADGYAQTAKSVYMANVADLDFTQPTALQSINRWCNEQTEGFITSIMDENDWNEDDLCFLLNCICFKAPWSVCFNTELTRKETFTDGNGQQHEVYMMHKTDNVNSYSCEVFHAISLPYANGNYQMMLILPDSEGNMTLTEVLDKLTANGWKAITESMKGNIQQTEVYLPRFQTESKAMLNAPLQQMGLTRRFTIDADLTKMLKSNERVFVNKMLQKARIEVSEEGTQAAAVTGGGIAPSSAPNTFLANRPFLYIIYETSTNAIFFMGEYTGVE